MTLPADAPGDGRPAAQAPGRPPAPRRLRAFLVGVVIAAVLAVVLFVGLGSTSTTSGTGGVVPIGSVAPDFTLASMTGGARVDLYALGMHRHHPVILNFFASSCVPCQEETPLLASTAAAERARGSVLQFVGVDVGEQRSTAVPFITQSGITYPVGQDLYLEVAGSTYGLNAEPQTFFIDESGVVVGHSLGAVTPTTLEGWVHRLSGGR